MNFHPSILVVAILLASLIGCDSQQYKTGPIEATGRVVLAETGEPIEGLGVSIAESILGVRALATVRTDAEGRFAVRYVVPETSGATTRGISYSVRANFPYDPQYTNSLDIVYPPETLDYGTIELRLNPQP